MNFALNYSRSLSSQSDIRGEENDKKRLIGIFRDESSKSTDWVKKYIPGSMFLIGSGVFGSVFQVSTRLYSQNRQKISKDRYVYHHDFLKTYASQRRMKPDNHEKFADRFRDSRLLDIVAIKYEILEQSQLDEGSTKSRLFLRREFLVLDSMWRKCPRQLVGFPVVFDFGYVGDKQQYGISPKYMDHVEYMSLNGDTQNFFTDNINRNLENVTKISYMAMELIGPSLDEIKNYFDPWYSACGLKTFFQVPTVFKIADQFLCRLLVLHKCGFVHHDLKPDNIALGNGRALNTIYLLDFGFARQVSNHPMGDWVGSRKFTSVETCEPHGKVNYAQDIESWFYVVCSLLYDQLPWSDEITQLELGENADDKAKWEMMIALKKSWWEDSSHSYCLENYFKSLEELHSGVVPDIRQLMEQLHVKVRDLRHLMLQNKAAETLNAELSNSQSSLFKGYMSIRKILLLIFDMPNAKNINVFDDEFKSMAAKRRRSNGVFFPFGPCEFHWEWDKNHELLRRRVGNEARQPIPTSASNAGNRCPDELLCSANSEPLLQKLLKLSAAKANSDQTARHSVDFSNCCRKSKDEITYFYDNKNRSLKPTVGRWRR